LAEAKATRAITISQWRELAVRLARDLPSKARAAWAAKLRAAYVPDPQALGALKLDDVQRLADVLNRLGDKQAYGTVAAWVEKTNEWPSFPPQALASLARSLARSGESGQAARLRVSEHVAAKYLADAAITKSVSVARWREFATSFAEDLSAETRATWVARLRSAYLPSAGSLAALKLDEVQRLSEALESLGDKQALAVVFAWVEQSTDWPSFTPRALLALVKRLSRHGKAGQAARLRVAAHDRQACKNRPNSMSRHGNRSSLG